MNYNILYAYVSVAYIIYLNFLRKQGNSEILFSHFQYKRSPNISRDNTAF